MEGGPFIRAAEYSKLMVPWQLAWSSLEQTHPQTYLRYPSQISWLGVSLLPSWVFHPLKCLRYRSQISWLGVSWWLSWVFRPRIRHPTKGSSFSLEPSFLLELFLKCKTKSDIHCFHKNKGSVPYESQ